MTVQSTLAWRTKPRCPQHLVAVLERAPVSLFLDLSFTRDDGYKVLLLASQAGDHNTQKKS
jgi:hypothetical protein